MNLRNILAVILVSTFALSAEARPKPEAFVQATIDARAETAVLDWPSIYANALSSRHRAAMSTSEASEFESLLRRLLTSSIRRNLDAIRRAHVKHVRTITDGAVPWASVILQVTPDSKLEEPFEVAFLLKGTPDSFVVYDVVVEKVSTVTSYEKQFGRVIDKEGVDGLLRRMRDKVKSIDSK